MKAWEVKDGVDAVFCETEADAQMIAREFERRLRVIGYSNPNVTIEEVEIIEIPESERRYIEQVRKRQRFD